MNLVELAQHNFSEPPRHPPPFRGKQQQYIFKQTKKKTCPLSSCCGPDEMKEEEKSGPEAQTVTSTHPVQLWCSRNAAVSAVTPVLSLLAFVCLER